MSSKLKPRVARRGKATQLSYELPHRVHVSKIYPVTAPNGSTIIIYGHDQGIHVLWRGGRPLKQREHAKETKPLSNGANNDAIMIIDSDEDEPPQSKPTGAPPEEAEYEDEEDEADPSEPYPAIVQDLDLPLGTEVLHLSVPRIPSPSPMRSADSIPTILSQNIVLSVACGDCSVRVITLPLAPPSAARKLRPQLGKGETRWSEEIALLGGQAAHQSIPTGVSMTWTSSETMTSTGDTDMDDGSEPEDGGHARSTPGRLRSRSRPRSASHEWDLLIASHSAELTGVLHIWRVPLLSHDGRPSLPADHIPPTQTQYLPSAAVHTAFNPAQHPSKRHSQLLIADSKGAVRIYDPFDLSRPRPRSSRQEAADVGLRPAAQGSWIATFSTNFAAPKHYDPSSPGVAQRKHILDVKWASDGKSIIGLLVDGEWGIWDVDCSGPRAAKDQDTKRPTSFSLRGFIGASSQSSLSSTSSNERKSRGARSSLAPMTPNTRRAKEDVLFHGPQSSTTGAPRGGISVYSTPSATGGRPEESVVLWYGNDVYSIPSLHAFWSRSVNSGGSSGGSLYGSGLTRVEGLNLQGELLNGVEQFPPATTAVRVTTQKDLLLITEYRLLVLSGSAAPDLQKTMALFSTERKDEDPAHRADQQLLAKGELDLGSMNRLLEGMEAGNGLLGAGRRVGFAT